MKCIILLSFADEKKTEVLSAAEVIQEQGVSGNIVSSPPIAPCLGRGSLPGADIDLSTTKKATSSIAKVLFINSHLEITLSTYCS